MIRNSQNIGRKEISEKLWSCWWMMVSNGEWWFINDVQCLRTILVMINKKKIVVYKPWLETHKTKKEKKMHWMQHAG